MEGLRGYLLTIILAAILCSVIRKLLSGKGSVATISRILCGIFLVLTVLQPLGSLVLPNWQDLTVPITLDAQEAIAVGENSSKQALKAIITEQLETYILDKAAQFHAGITVKLTLSEDPIPIPLSVTITGSISPYGKQQLQTVIADTLGISKENQIWNDRQP